MICMRVPWKIFRHQRTDVLPRRDRTINFLIASDSKVQSRRGTILGHLHMNGPVTYVYTLSNDYANLIFKTIVDTQNINQKITSTNVLFKFKNELVKKRNVSHGKGVIPALHGGSRTRSGDSPGSPCRRPKSDQGPENHGINKDANLHVTWKIV